MRVRRKTVTNMIFIFNDFSVSSLLYCEHFCFQKWQFKKRNASKFANLRRKPSSFFRFLFQATLSFCFMNARLDSLAVINFWNQKSSVFYSFFSAVYFNIKILHRILRLKYCLSISRGKKT